MRLGLVATIVLLLWALVSALLALRVGAGWDEALLLGLPWAVVGVAIGIAVRYPCRALPLGSGHFVRSLVNHAATILVSAGMWVLVGRFLARLLESLPRYAGAAARFDAEASTFAVVGLLVFVLAVVASYLLRALESARAAELAGVESSALAREAELRALRSQLGPHFLFNSLNSIATLTSENPSAARRMCLLLAQFMRRSLALEGHDRITLGEELALIRDYLEIEKVRFGERLAVDLSVEEACRAVLVPPLLLQPLVENAVRHGIAQRLEGGTLAIEAGLEDGALRIRIDNPRDPQRGGGRGSGVGLENVRGRLANLYGGTARLEVTRREDAFRVVVLLPLEPAASTGEYPRGA